MESPRRRHVRVPVELPVFVYAGREERAKASARNVSMSGLRLMGGAHGGVGSRVYLEYALPPHRDVPVMAIGKVVWSKPTEAGVEVLRYFPSARFAVRSFLDRRRNRRVNYNLFDEP